MDAKEEYLRQLEEKLETWDRQIEELRAQSDEKDIQSELLTRVFQKRERVDRDVEELRQAGGDQWEQYKSTVAASTQDLQDALFRTTPRVESKIQEGTTTPPAHQGDERGIEGGV